ncbi:hypothetical protein [Planotetraspora kaengkrachanensis]|uniref:PIN domain-containing protein n=1 Tax=Planotetraspora kaengkrachanensis TaxID=575193 RepID=A0A8J3M3I1_9ACTN|nr:hypothetical protein [Planotetraspora kaengkrachanensis]GIG78475.1 hypothetical protein Pka01_16020 [Planotetraspora kaengkrachanensis]
MNAVSGLIMDTSALEAWARQEPAAFMRRGEIKEMSASLLIPSVCVAEAFSRAGTDEERRLITQILGADFTLGGEESALTSQQALLVSYRLLKGTAVSDLSLAHAAAFYDLRGWPVLTRAPRSSGRAIPTSPSSTSSTERSHATVNAQEHAVSDAQGARVQFGAASLHSAFAYTS